MKLTRPALALAVGLAVAVSGPSFAAAKKPAPKPVCNLVTDVAADANNAPLVGTVAAGPSEPAYDIRSVDIASNGSYITGVVRVTKLAKSSSTSPTGIHWAAGFTLDGTEYFLSASSHPVGEGAASINQVDPTTGTYDGIGGATAVYDFKKNEVRISARLKEVGLRITPGKTVLTALRGFAGREYYVPNVVTGQDYTDLAESAKTYKAGTLSCVTPGK